MALGIKYEFNDENKIYEFWKNSGYFTSGDLSKKPYCIVIPPPNVTGVLHLGHALDNTLQDIIIRRKRMQGFDALYLPGMDHAGIATQAKVDELLRKDGISRFDIGRVEFLKVAWKWKEDHASIIHKQWEALGLSVDYTKERFTLDEGLSRAVNKVFIDSYNKGLIYRGNKIINWDPQAKTALSNVEVEHKETATFLYYLRYKLESSNDYIVVATTRPETCFADQAVMVNPNDKRYKHLVGKKVIIPTTNTLIPVITDEYVDISFGTGIVKVTPAHDFNDFEVSIRHNLNSPLCMNADATMNNLAGIYEGLDRFECRKRLLEDLEILNQIDHIDPYNTSIGYSERTGVMVEPRLSLQWFLKMDELSKNALLTKTKFVPKRYFKIFANWMSDTRDWCISRQLWWGHRIPAWYKNDEVIVSATCPGEGYIQDEDVLDTWFSSALWPFSTLNWPEESDLLKRYFPTNTLVTGYDIIFFWVSRMIFMSREFLNIDPFKHVLIHGIIRDTQGRKMSKSLGNGVDPLEVKANYGIDSLRLFISTSSAPGTDFRYDQTKIESSWNFINKLWNIARYIELNTADIVNKANLKIKQLNSADKYIINKLYEVIKQTNYYYDKFEFTEVNRILYNFIWGDFASWYVEYSKVSIQNKLYALNTKKILLYVLENILKLLHPFIPFVTEKLYLELFNNGSIMISKWPNNKKYDKNSISDFELLKSAVTNIRNLRNENNIIPSKPLHIVIQSANLELINESRSYLEKYLNTSKLEIVDEFKDIDAKYILVSGVSHNLYVLKEDIIDIKRELEELRKQEEILTKEVARSEAMLSNASFIQKAPKEKVAIEQAKYEDYKNKLALVVAKIKQYETGI